MNRTPHLQASNLTRNQQGFTLIELIMVIVILGILAVVAIPKYVDMKTEAAESQAEGVFGAAQSAAAVNFSAIVAGKTGLTAITNGTTLLGAMDGTPDGWAVNGTRLSASISDTTYSITVTTGETSTSKAQLTKSW